MLSEFISEEERDWNLLKTSIENCLDKILFEETDFQSINFRGWGLAFLDTRRLSLTLDETIRWSDPTELKEE